VRNLFTRIGAILATVILTASVMTSGSMVLAATTAPQKLMYSARLLTSTGTPITSSHSVRFSFWNTADYVSSDTTGAGAINTGSSGYANWQEVHTVTPDSRGYFSVELGSSTALPAIDSYSAQTLLSMFVQVEVKEASAAETSYEILDPKPISSTVDRSPVLSVPFALNADRIDQRDVGTGSGSIAPLGSGGLLPVSTVPEGTNRDTFTIDSNNTASSMITLQFGQTLGKTLSYDISNSRFVFNDDVLIQGNLNVTGVINGININTLTSAASPLPLRVASGAGLNATINAGGYRLNGNITNYAGGSASLSDNTDNYLFFSATGGLVVRSGSFPTDISFIPLAKVTTVGGSITVVTDQRVLQNDNREHTVSDILHPSFPDAAFQADGADNVGQLSVLHDNASKNNAYQWTTTRSTQQDYTIVVRATLPQQFVRWKSTPVTLAYKTSSGDTAVAKANVQIFDTAGNAVSISGGSNLASTSWTNSNITYSGTPTWTAGQSFTIKVTVHAKDNATVNIGDLKLQYVTLDKETP
jgi:hypothetical protein